MLFDKFSNDSLTLLSRVVMAPLTRSRADTDNQPNALMAEYYGQRASAGLIITEGTAPSPNALGYPRIPALFNAHHVDGWKLVTDAVHANGGKIFVQLMHTGRVAHVANMPQGAEVLGSSGDALKGEMFTDSKGMQPYSTPKVMTAGDIQSTIGEYVTSARLAMAAGFDGIELHGANGYLLEQFLNGNINQRTDNYGGSAEGRNRFAIEVARATADAIGGKRVGMRLSPYGVVNGGSEFSEVEPQYVALVDELSKIGLLYIHVLDHSAVGTPPVPQQMKDKLRQTFKGLYIATGGFDLARAEAALEAGQADLIAFGRTFLANPDLPRRLREGAALNPLNPATLYTPGAKGYTDYPMLNAEGV